MLAVQYDSHHMDVRSNMMIVIKCQMLFESSLESALTGPAKVFNH